jgi:hypothetical protein
MKLTRPHHSAPITSAAQANRNFPIPAEQRRANARKTGIGVFDDKPNDGMTPSQQQFRSNADRAYLGLPTLPKEKV